MLAMRTHANRKKIGKQKLTKEEVERKGECTTQYELRFGGGVIQAIRRGNWKRGNDLKESRQYQK